VTTRSALESALVRDRWLVGGALATAVLLSWAWIVPMALDMYGSMSGPSAWMMAADRGVAHHALLFAMWLAMMVGMMLPSAAPAILIYTAVIRRSSDGDDAATRAYLFAAGYLAVWTAFSAAATLLHSVLTSLTLVSPMMQITRPVLGGALLVVAGIYQMTSLKQSCLASCRSPATFLTEHWRAGRAGAWRLGLEHGLYCFGCCWALMLLLFVGGVMSLLCIAAITVFVLAEKVAPLGVQGGRLSGVALIVAGTWLAATRLV
jgi:predicted metal-binding membrane protein